MDVETLASQDSDGRDSVEPGYVSGVLEGADFRISPRGVRDGPGTGRTVLPISESLVIRIWRMVAASNKGK